MHKSPSIGNDDALPIDLHRTKQITKGGNASEEEGSLVKQDSLK